MSFRILITGAQGQVGSFVHKNASLFGFDPIALAREDLDIADSASVMNALQAHKPDLVINCAAYTAVDRAESEIETANQVNNQGPDTLAAACNPDIPLLHISTDYVFNGLSQTPYTEDAPTDPINVYGKSKLDGENATLAAHTKALILRTAWVYGPTHNNFLKTMIRLGREKENISVVHDQFGSPTHAEDIATTLLKIAHTILTKGDQFSDYGVYHYTGGGKISWCDFAEVIFDELEIILGKRPQLQGIATAEYPTPAKRASYSVLDNSKITRIFDITPMPWEDRVRETVRSYINSEGEVS